MIRSVCRAALVLIVCCSAAIVHADDAYFHIAAGDLSKFVEGKLPETKVSRDLNARWWYEPEIWAYAVVDGKGEAYVANADSIVFRGNRGDTVVISRNDREEHAVAGLLIRAPAGAEVTGKLFLPYVDSKSMVSLKFKIPASEAKENALKDFLQAKAWHYERLINQGVPGGAWFRHQDRKTRIALGDKPGDPNAAGANQQFIARGSVEDTYDLFSGGRALSENLQLDRTAPTAKPDVPTVDVTSLEGITIATIDWIKYLKADAKPQLDPLAAAIPHDQHAVFFPSFAKLLEVADQADRQGTTILQFANPRSEDAGVQKRYERQLCLSTSALARLLGPAVVRSVAVTGSDPYFPTGTDVAILFESGQPEALHTLIGARVWQGAQSAGVKVKTEKGFVGGKGENAVAYVSYRSDDRAVCSYVARLEETIVVTNSPAQLERLAEVQQKKVPSLASLEEYRFFRTRYPLGSNEESALVFLSDPTIRRWCGPKWRIASSRRTRDLAVMDELQADFLDKLVAGSVDPGPIHADYESVDLDDVRLLPAGVESSTLGSLGFQTPIVELPWDKVTKQEADLYTRWRDSYQNNWRWAFDPIALRIHCGQSRLAADLTVMPLIFASDYREGIELSRGVKIAPTAGDPHGAALQWVMAFNRDSRPMRSAGNLLGGMLPGQTDPLSWLGSSIAAWVEEDPFWDELARKTENAEREKFFEENLARLPVAVQIGVSSRIKLAAFLVGLRGIAEQTVPGMLTWESLTFHDQAYVKISLTERGKKELPAGMKDPSLYYAILPEGLLLTLSQKMLEQSIDRQAAREKAAAEGKPAPPLANPWIGESQCLQVNQKAVAAFAQLGRDAYRSQMQRLAWNNLPILNEWKRRYPDRDPMAVQEEFWHTRLICPGGGKYVWNEAWQTMESTVYGHPGQPKDGPAMPPALAEFVRGNFGLTYEEEGLRARLELDRAPGEKDQASKALSH